MATRTQHTISASEAQSRFGTVLDWIEAGDEVVITRRGRVVARMVSADTCHDRAEARLAADVLLSATRGWRLNGAAVSELRTVGQR